LKVAASLATIVGTMLWQLGSAWAYCRTTTCDRTDAPVECVNSRVAGCSTLGVPVAWPSTCVSSSVSAQASPLRGISADVMRSLVSQAFQQWTSAPCTVETHPNFVVDMYPDVTCTNVTGDAGYFSKGPNYNLWIFHDDSWPLADTGGESAIAVTSAQFDRTTGEIFDADVELNSYGVEFTTGDTGIKVDLKSVIQHESGHFLGLAHSQDTEATMYADLDPKTSETKKRTLNGDDVAAICAVYPPGRLDPNCDPEPRHGFSTSCELQSPSCAIAPNHRAKRLTPFVTVMLGFILAMGATRRRRAG
jgi:hypothetical protein